MKDRKIGDLERGDWIVFLVGEGKGRIGEGWRG